MIDIKEITDPDEKSRVCDATLKALPRWFGNADAVAGYTEQVRHMPFYAAFYDGAPVGFAAVKVHNLYTAEICVMGILAECHRRGIGRRLVNCCENYCITHKMSFLTVKTLDASRQSASYEKTRLFYLSVGFKPLEVFPLYWDEDNPCLFLAKYIGGVDSAD